MDEVQQKKQSNICVVVVGEAFIRSLVGGEMPTVNCWAHLQINCAVIRSSNQRARSIVLGIDSFGPLAPTGKISASTNW